MTTNQKLKEWAISRMLNQPSMMELVTKYAKEDGSIDEEDLWKELPNSTIQAWQVAWKLHLQLLKLQPPIPTARIPTPDEAAFIITRSFRIIIAKFSRIAFICRNCAISAYKELSWGWQEKVCQEALKIELIERGLRVKSEIPRTIIYKGQPLGDGVYSRTDVEVFDPISNTSILLELKADQASASTVKKARQQLARYMTNLSYSPTYGMVIIFPDKELSHVQCFPL
jgi:GxxExxY protein